MGGRDHVGTSRVHLGVDGERGGVHHRVALHHRAGVVDADEVGDADVLEVHAERVDPEPVQVLRIARGDVAGDALVEAELAEQPERRREPLLAVQPLLLDGVELGKEGQVGKQSSHGQILGPVLGRYSVGGHSARRASAGRIRAAERAGHAARRLATTTAAGSTSTTATRASGGT